MQGLLSLGSFILGAIAHHGVALCQVEVECDQRAVLHAQCTQSRTINLGNKHANRKPLVAGTSNVCEAKMLDG